VTPRLFTPGPLTTDRRVREAMQRDWGSRDADFIALTAELRTRLLGVVPGAAERHVAVPIQGAGSYALEAAVATLVGPEHRLLVLVNGAYGRRMDEIARRMGRSVAAIDWREDEAVDPARVASALADDAAITHVAIVQCETTTGLLNPVDKVAHVVAEAGRVLIVDAMSGFGALPLGLGDRRIGAILASSNKCLEGPPGIAFALVERDLLAAAKGRSPSLALDLHDQARGFETNGQWRFTPPMQVVAGLVEALRLHEAEGGSEARLARYEGFYEVLRLGMQRLGYPLYLDPSLQAPIIATFRPRPGRPFDFARLHAHLAQDGLLIYPGKLTTEVTFRIGCIGALTDSDFDDLLESVASYDVRTHGVAEL
jgi:2-aminoethylphosphonate-pyruvate transaminase